MPAHGTRFAKLGAEARAAAQRTRLRLEHLPTGPTRAAWDHGAKAGPCVSWRLDHVRAALGGTGWEHAKFVLVRVSAQFSWC